MILVSIDWKPETPEEDRFFSITSYGSEQTTFIDTELLPTKYTNYSPYEDLLLQIFLSKGKQESPNVQKDIMKEQANGELVRYTTNQGYTTGYRFRIFENTTDDLIFSEKGEYSESVGV